MTYDEIFELVVQRWPIGRVALIEGQSIRFFGFPEVMRGDQQVRALPPLEQVVLGKVYLHAMPPTGSKALYFYSDKPGRHYREWGLLPSG